MARKKQKSEIEIRNREGEIVMPACLPARPSSVINEPIPGCAKEAATPACATCLASRQAADRIKKEVYSFPTRSRCPRCKTTDTIATHTEGKIQRRICQRAICRQKYVVFGTKI